MPSPPCCAIAIAMCDSVTVSMAALIMGIFRRIFRVKLGLRIGQGGNHVRMRGQQQHVIEGKGFGNGKMNHMFSQEKG